MGQTASIFRLHRSWIGVAAGLAMAWCSAGASIAAELVMLEKAGCAWCERWDKEIGPVYSKTSEGKLAPLRRIDIHKQLPPDLKFLSRGGYTPTFILVEGGREIGRIRGYPGEDFFWGLLGQLQQQLPSAETPLRDSRTKITN